MLVNFHTHTTYSDGKHSPEEVVISAIEKGFDTIGFSDHGYTPFDLRYCMTDLEGYIAEINRLKIKYADKITILLGIEEDILAPVDRSKFDFVISSSHYLYKDGKYLPFDSTREYFLDALSHFENPIDMAKAYYDTLCDYLEKNKTDIIGHFDLITKYEEQFESLLLSDERYWEIAENAVRRALKIGCVFEVNTGLMTRGYRTTPCPHERLLKIILKENGKIALASDSHHKDTLSAHFDSVKEMLKAIGFTKAYAFTGKDWISYDL